MKSKIVAIENKEIKTYIRIKRDSSSQKNYNRFKQDLKDKFNIEVKGNKGFKEIYKRDKIDINIFKNQKTNIRNIN